MTKKMTRTEEHDFYADPENQTPQGSAQRRTPGAAVVTFGPGAWIENAGSTRSRPRPRRAPSR